MSSQSRVIYSSTPVKRLLWDCGLSDDRAEAQCGAIDETEGGIVIRVTRALQRLAEGDGLPSERYQISGDGSLTVRLRW